ncbi:hypothetical protein NEMBOFW57_000555 [Staphylotrichum longicolle]|uniref:LysM domain-containing protein n=1 Tax=Staphylotrichum longicolle TaxID=669026 RepID=A0AAD4HZZ9_9PEZI|nr:hypothetical protein NEMBOFW57_000555 [Staphylotrichum longicolle]
MSQEACCTCAALLAAVPRVSFHHLRHPPDPNPDTLLSLSLQYNLAPSTLRRHNRLPNDADYLLAARHTLLIPTTTTTTTDTPDEKRPAGPVAAVVSLSPHPPESAAERERKVTIRRWMVACKEPDYDTAVVYLEESGYDFQAAVRRYREDGEWERRHPLHAHDNSSSSGGGGGAKQRWKGKGKREEKGLASGSGEGGGRMKWFRIAK